MSPQVQIKPWLHCRPLSAVFCCLYSALGPPLAGARCHRSHFGSRYRSGLGFPAGLFLSIAAASCCLAPCSAHLLLELDVTAGTDQALAPLPASFCCFVLSLQRTGPWLPSRPLFVNCCCFLLSCSLQRTPLAGARCHRRYRSSLGSIAGLFLLFFVVFTAHWAHLLLELDVTVALLAQGTDQALASQPASFCQLLLLLVVLLLAAHTSCCS